MTINNNNGGENQNPAYLIRGIVFTLLIYLGGALTGAVVVGIICLLGGCQ